jgi:Signal transduction histidine kinase
MKMDRLQSYEAEQRLRQGSNFGRDLSAVTDLTRLLAHLDSYLINMAVGDFHLLLFEGKEVETQGDRGLLVYERKGGRRVVLPEGGQDIGLEEFFSTRPGFPGRSWDLCLSHLMSGEEDLGLALYSVDDWAQPHLTAATPHVANALRRLRVLAEQEDRNRSLELMVDARTKDLTLANEMLTREVELRTAAEAEVLQISEFERRRFGLDLHDDICQRLAGISMYIRGFQSRKPDDPAAILVEMADLVDETLHLTRRYAHASFPIDLERRGLDRVLRSHCETVAIQNRCICRYSSELPRLDPPLDDSQALNVYRIVQEALHNAVRHSGATVLEVIVDVESELCTIRVADNGRGLDGSAQAKGGLGLRSMEYRASQLGAGFRIESRPGMGTVVRLEIPRRTRA